MSSLSPRIALIGTVAAIAIATVGFNVSRAASQPEPDYSTIGKTDGLRCWDLPIRKCEGFSSARFPKDSLYGEPAKKLIKWLRDVDWDTQSAFQLRNPKSDESSQVGAFVAPVRSTSKVGIDHLPGQGALFAKITLRTFSPTEELYGLGGVDNSEFETTYYVVVERKKSTPPEDKNGDTGARRVVGTYYFLGIKSNGTVHRIGKAGTIAWCGHPHPNKKDQADFSSCLETSSIYPELSNPRTVAVLDSAIGGGRESNFSFNWLRTSAARFVADKSVVGRNKILQDSLQSLLKRLNPETNPIWMTCGVGCCIIEPN